MKQILIQTSPQFEEVIKNDILISPSGHQSLDEEGILVAQVFLQNELLKLGRLSGRNFNSAIGIIARSKRLETLRGIAYNQDQLKKSIEAQLTWDKLLSEHPEQHEALLLEAFDNQEWDKARSIIDKRIEMEAKAFDKIISDPQQLEQHLEHETRAATLSGGKGMEQP